MLANSPSVKLQDKDKTMKLYDKDEVMKLKAREAR
ncbi:uncharacterized protein G2W53_023625 [Senna tora]|uniref:Uncharacterized protein n=1 Tax=Senna tora TaxID=362788 RepID=A0A834TBF7_9FABA|nr:uncharacterized protein G2W53_023625 [Senna tora]